MILPHTHNVTLVFNEDYGVINEISPSWCRKREDMNSDEAIVKLQMMINAIRIRLRQRL